MSYVSSGSANGSGSVVLSATNIQDGDILIAYVSAGKSSSMPPYPTAITGPAGWTVSAESVISSIQRYAVLWKRASSESGSYTFTQDYASATMIGTLGVYRGVVETGSPIDVISNTPYLTNNTIVRAASITPTVADGMFVYGGYQWGGFPQTVTAPSGMTSRQSVAGGGSGALNLSDLVYTTTDPSGIKDGTAGGSSFLKHAFLVALEPSVEIPPANGFACSVTTAASCTGTVLLRMSGSVNAHAELPNQSTPIYNDNVVCCSGVTGLGNSCVESNHGVIARLSGVTNAHVEKNSEVGVNYTQNACLSSTYAGDEITIGYQPTNCDGYDTTLFSMSQPATNSQVGIPTAYDNKVCAKIFSQSISFNISDNSAGFGNLNSAGLRFATPDGVGSATETEAYSLAVSTNAPSGYIVMLKGESLAKNSIIIDPIGGTPTTPSAGSKAFGIRAVAAGGTGFVVAPYNGSGFAYDASGNSFSTLAQASAGDGSSTSYSIRSVATIDSLLDPGEYSTNLTYIVTANY